MRTQQHKKSPVEANHSSDSSSFFQPKLAVNQPNDVYEQEADAMGEKIMRMPYPVVSDNFFFKPAISSVQPKSAHCEDEKKKELQRKKTGINESATDTSTEHYISSLNGNGKSLTQNERHFFEPRFGYDFSNVQLHTDIEANRSAENINALAYTHGKHVVFGANQYEPNADGSKKLMAHELTHVIQQNGQAVDHPATKTALVQRQEHGGEHSTPDNRTIILTWLEQHQFAPPSEQPATGEQQVLLNGEITAISQAVDLAVRDLHLPREIVSDIISSEATRLMPISSHGAAYVGGGNQVPGLPLEPHTPAQLLLIAQANELGQIDDWLDNHHFSKLHNPDPLRAMLNDHDYTMEQIADQAVAIVGASSHLSRRDIMVHLRRRYVSAPSASGNQWSFQASTGGVLHHYVTPAGATDPLREWVVQTTAAYTRQFHGANQSGLELQGLIQAQYSITTGQWSVLGGGQATYAIDLSHNFTAGIFAQLLTGAVLTDPLQWQIQPAIGAQIVWQPADWFSIGLQGSGSYTRAFGGPSSVDAGGSFLITISR